MRAPPSRSLSRPAYEKCFGKAPYVIGRRQMLLTYAEWLHFVDFIFEPELPAMVRPYLGA